jgi:arylsulfatase A-like enzyme
MKAIVIVANGWHPGWLGCYGNELVETPHVDRLAAESVVFDQHFAVNPSSTDWQRSLLSGYFEFFAGKKQKSLLDALSQSGVRIVRWREEREQPNADEDAAPGEAFLEAVAEQLSVLAAQDRWLLWIETDRLLPPWSVSLDYFDKYVEGIAPDENGAAAQPWDEPPLGRTVLTESEIERLHGTFAAVVSEWDADLGRCFEMLRQAGLAESAWWIITSGHGLSLSEHDWIGPSSERPYEELAHVPLIVRLPNGEQGGRRVAQQTASVDLLPTLCEAFGVPVNADVHGKSLLAIARGAQEPIHPYVCQSFPTGELALRTPEWSLLSDGQSPSLLFRKPGDRWEMCDQRIMHLEWAEHLETTLRQFVDSMANGPFRPPELKHYDEVVTPENPETPIAP